MIFLHILFKNILSQNKIDHTSLENKNIPIRISWHTHPKELPMALKSQKQLKQGC